VPSGCVAAMPMRNIYSWNAMIAGLAMNGGERQALSLWSCHGALVFRQEHARGATPWLMGRTS
jgi:hypothetical protein